jgi:hypothetical protein
MGQFAVVIEVRSRHPSLLNWYVRDVMSPFSRFEVNSYQIFEVAPSLYMVDVRKVAGETLEYHRVCSLSISHFIILIIFVGHHQSIINVLFHSTCFVILKSSNGCY